MKNRVAVMKNNHPLPEFWKNSPSPIVVAHRGGDLAGIEKENSMKAFKAAYEAGYRWFETDVVPTRDGKLIAIHGRGFQLHPNRDLPFRLTIQKKNLDEILPTLKVGGEQVVLFEELLKSFPDVKFFVDPKTAKAAKCLIKELISHPNDLHRISVGSFVLKRNLMIRRRVKRATGVDICTALLGPVSAWPLYWTIRIKYFHAFAHRYVKKSHASSVRVPYVWITSAGERGKAFVSYAHQLGIKVEVYTPNGADDIQQSLEAGVDVVMSDNLKVQQRAIKHFEKSNMAGSVV